MTDYNTKNCFHCIHGLQMSTSDAWCDIDVKPHHEGCDETFGNYIFGMAHEFKIERITVDNIPIRPRKTETTKTSTPKLTKPIKPNLQSSMF